MPWIIRSAALEVDRELQIKPIIGTYKYFIYVGT